MKKISLLLLFFTPHQAEMAMSRAHLESEDPSKTQFQTSSEAIIQPKILPITHAKQAKTPDIFKIIARNPNPEILDKLYNEDSKIFEQTDKDNQTPLMFAIKHIIKDSLAPILKKPKENILIDHQDKFGNTALHIAVQYNSPSLTYSLIQAGANINIQNNSKKTPLRIAIEKNNVNIVKILLQHKANPNIIDAQKRTDLHTFVQYAMDNDEQSDDEQSDDEQNKNEQNKKILELLLNNDADINAKDIYGFTPLHLALISGHLYLAQLLIEANANVNIQDEDNETPLHTAILFHSDRNPYTDIIKTLIEKTNLKLKNKHKKTPKDLANEFNKIDILKFINAKALSEVPSEVTNFNSPKPSSMDLKLQNLRQAAHAVKQKFKEEQQQQQQQ